MFVWGRLADAVDLLQTALRPDVAFVPGAPFFTGTPGSRDAAAVVHHQHAGADRRGVQRLGSARAEATGQRASRTTAPSRTTSTGRSSSPGVSRGSSR
jgi:2-aminoadipate transaminase